MKCIILAGGMQSTLTRDNESIPKPMIEIGGKPLIWHIMKHFSEYGITEFIVCGGYKIDVIKEYFLDFYVYGSDITVDLSDNTVTVHNRKTENWKVSVIDTGMDADVVDRIFAVKDMVSGDFIVTYGDCISDVDVDALVKEHRDRGVVATMMLTRSTGRRRFIQYAEDAEEYLEDNVGSNAWISGDCYVFNEKVFDRTIEEHISIDRLFGELNQNRHMAMYRHEGYWAAVETMRDLVEVEMLWESNDQTWIKNR